MTPTEALERLRRLTNWTAAPELLEAEVDDLLDRARRPDAYGRPPGATDWLPTYDLNAAAAAGWRLKVAALAGTGRLTSFSADGASFGKADPYREALEQARYFEGLAAGPLDMVASGPATPGDIGSVPVTTSRDGHRLDMPGAFPDGAYPVVNG